MLKHIKDLELKKIDLAPLRQVDWRPQIVNKPTKRRRARKSARIDLLIGGVPVTLRIYLEKQEK